MAEYLQTGAAAKPQGPYDYMHSALDTAIGRLVPLIVTVHKLADHHEGPLPPEPGAQKDRLKPHTFHEQLITLSETIDELYSAVRRLDPSM